MSGGLLFLLVAGGAAVALALRTYLRDEPRVSRRWMLATVRVAAILLLFALLWNPALSRSPEPGGAPWLVVDGTLGMTARDQGGSTPWAEAVERADAAAGAGERIAVYEGELRTVGLEDLRAFEPARPGTELAAAVRRAAEAGAPEITILSDLRAEDREAVRRAAMETSAPVRLERVGGDPRNAGILRFELPTRISSDEPVRVELELFGEGGEAGDSVAVEVLEEDRVVLSRARPLPARGERVREPLELPPPREAGLVRYEVRLELEEDGFPWDDRAVAYADVDADEGGVVLLSLRPDWEPRFLLPVLRTTTGLPGRGFLRLSGDRFLPLVEGTDEVGAVAREEVEAALARADVLVLHGLEGAPESWVSEAASAAPRVLVLPVDAGGASVAGLATGSPLDGEWFLDPEVPGSPVAPYLGERIDSPERIPPLQGVLPLEGDPEGSVPLRARRARRGDARPVLFLREVDGRRVATTLATGFWRWAMRAGEHRLTYRRLWAGVATWLVSGGVELAGPDLRPEELVLPADEPIPWRAPGREGRELRVRIRSVDGEEDDGWDEDARVRVSEVGRFSTSPLPTGTYAFRVEGSDEDGAEVGAGRFDVVRSSRELSIAPWEPVPAFEGEEEGGVVGPEVGRPLRTHPMPWVLLIGLLCVEWVVRRRVGLR